jgi:hypothetical protein
LDGVDSRFQMFRLRSRLWPNTSAFTSRCFRSAGTADGSIRHHSGSIGRSRLHDDPGDTLQHGYRRRRCLLASSRLTDALALLVGHLDIGPACLCRAAPSPLRRAEPSPFTRNSASSRHPCRSDVPSWRASAAPDRRLPATRCPPHGGRLAGQPAGWRPT